MTKARVCVTCPSKVINLIDHLLLNSWQSVALFKKILNLMLVIQLPEQKVLYNSCL